MNLPPNGSIDVEARQRVTGDFGGIVRETPAAVVRAKSAQDVVAALRFAAESGRPVVARGQGHTTRGQSQAAGGVVIDLGGVRHLCVDEAAHTVRVGAGLTWSSLVTRTLATGLVPPTLTDYLGLSVGGTLSVGGIGGQSFRHGAQTDQVQRLVVVTGSGEIIECSRKHEPELFDACRGGLGQSAIIVEAVLDLIPAPAVALVGNLAYPALRDLLADEERLVEDGRFDYLLGSVLPAADGWSYRLEAVKYLAAGERADADELVAGLVASGAQFRTMSFWEHASRLDDLVARMKADGRWAALHPWMDLFVPASAALDVISFALSVLDPAEISDGHLMTYPLAGRALSTPLLGVPPGGRSFLFDILPNLRNAEALPGFEARCHAILEHARTGGATIYPIGYPVGTRNMAPEHWRRQFGKEGCAALAAARERHDPDKRLGRGIPL